MLITVPHVGVCRSWTRHSKAVPVDRREARTKFHPRSTVKASGSHKASAHVVNEVGRRAASISLVCAMIAPGLTYWTLPAAGVAAVTSGNKRKNLSIDALKEIIAADIRKGQYFVTGKLTKEIYREDCRFRDPTNETVGLEKYLQAVSILFDPARSKQELLSIAVTSPTTIDAKWTLGGYLKFPWKPRVVPFEGTTQYVVDPDGLVALHDEKWSISPFTALLETITPSFGPI